LRAIYDRLDGLLIPGGVDINPAEYGEAQRPECGNLDPARDRVELQLVRWAIDEGKPVLGLCRGLQIINVAQGGTMWQDLASQNPSFHKHDFFPTAGYAREHLAHDVDIVPNTRLSQMLQSTRCPVNSMHHQGVKTLGRNLTVSARADDGLIEAVEGVGESFVVGVQWHPEVFEMADPHTRHFFAGFIRAAVDWSTANDTTRSGVGG